MRLKSTQIESVGGAGVERGMWLVAREVRGGCGGRGSVVGVRLIGPLLAVLLSKGGRAVCLMAKIRKVVVGVRRRKNSR